MPYKVDPRKGSRHNREHRAAYMREYRARTSGGGTALRDKPFRGIDGEGGGEKGTRHPGYHAYFLLSAGRSSILPAGDNIRISTSEALRFIASLDESFCYVGYFFDYDVTKILEDLPATKLDRLMNREKRLRKDGKGVFPVDYGPYEIDYLPRKEFKVRRKGGTWRVISDVGPFFQCRFLTALENWNIGTHEERERIARGKDMRGNFQIADIEEIAEYNALEIRLLEQLMEKFRASCYEVDVKPDKWQGPGQLAKSLMARERVPLSKNVPLLNDPEFLELMMFGRNSYYGGRPELGAIGPVTQPVFQWDINSAYPHAMRSVPCLMHGGWEKEEYVSGMDAGKIRTDAAIVYGSFGGKKLRTGERTPLWYGLPVRSADGSICYPREGTGWYWLHEILASKHQDFTAETAWVYRRQCDCQPLAFVSGVYNQRLSMGKDGPGIILKLALNSLYGITVQSIGSPAYANPIWGSYITSICRTMVQEFIHSSPACKELHCGTDILMVATDSVATISVRDDLRDTKELGGWSRETHPNGMFLIQPGLYFGSSGKHAKTRGVPLSAIQDREEEFRAAFARMCESRRLEDGDVAVPAHMFVGIRAALHRRNHKLLGQWIEYAEREDGTKGKIIRFDWTTKRRAIPVLAPIGDRTYLQTFPKDGDAGIPTVPYSKDIGGVLKRELERALLEAAPDWQREIEPGEMK
jgi:hypothetical protein